MVLLVILQILIVIEINNLSLTRLPMVGIRHIHMKNDWLMSMEFNTMLVLLTAMIVLRVQMRMRRHPLKRHKGGKQNENKNCVRTSLNHESWSWEITGSISLNHNAGDYTQPMKSRFIGRQDSQSAIAGCSEVLISIAVIRPKRSSVVSNDLVRSRPEAVNSHLVLKTDLSLPFSKTTLNDAYIFITGDP
ncbi:MAG: hypothetical protein KKG03_05465 [Gammaproteobacteria bacterium]|jgi:hypothetical protein|nr:hypothetical protein [Gammaproteobacteria bacterium]